MTEPRTIIVVTGMSGAGRSTALHLLEDLDFFCIDNLPTPLMERAVELLNSTGRPARIGIGTDVRVREFLEGVEDALGRLRQGGDAVTVLFLDAEDDVLVRRYSETRRLHPLAFELRGAALGSMIHAERERLLELRRLADRVIDTSHLSPHELRRMLQEVFTGTGVVRMRTRLLSFGFKHGVPVDADLVFDVRFLPNPHFVPELRPLTGRDAPVAQYVLEQPETAELLQRLLGLLEYLLPRYAREGKAVLTVAVGCTGGRHRSVAVVEALASSLRRSGAETELTVGHRDSGRGEGVG